MSTEKRGDGMAENEGLDLSKIVNLIMENPKLIEEISNLAKNEKPTSPEAEESISESNNNSAENIAAVDTYTTQKPRKSRRVELLGAMKPYLSDERAKALDSVLTIAEILDLMKER